MCVGVDAGEVEGEEVEGKENGAGLFEGESLTAAALGLTSALDGEGPVLGGLAAAEAGKSLLGIAALSALGAVADALGVEAGATAKELEDVGGVFFFHNPHRLLNPPVEVLLQQPTVATTECGK